MKVLDMQQYPLTRPDHEGVLRTTPQALLAAAKAAKLGGLMVVLDTGYFRRPGAAKALKDAARARPDLRFAAAFDFRAKDWGELLDEGAAAGLRSFKLHAYAQKVTPADHAAILALGRRAEKKGLYPTVCCSYGTRELGKHSGVAAAAHLAAHLKGPVVMAHAGGAKLLDAMLVAEDLGNVLFDTSFTLDYYLGSSVEADLAFAMRKTGAARWMFGSDSPFVDQAVSLRNAKAFLKRHRFTDRDGRRLFSETAETLR